MTADVPLVECVTNGVASKVIGFSPDGSRVVLQRYTDYMLALHDCATGQKVADLGPGLTPALGDGKLAALV